MCIDSNNILYVADRINDTVCVYSTSGQFLGYIGNSDGSSFDSPRFIVSDNDRLYISDQQWSDHLQVLPTIKFVLFLLCTLYNFYMKTLLFHSSLIILRGLPHCLSCNYIS